MALLEDEVNAHPGYHDLHYVEEWAIIVSSRLPFFSGVGLHLDINN
jgi:hypothetical protein